MRFFSPGKRGEFSVVMAGRKFPGTQVFKTRVRMTRFPNEWMPDPSPKAREIARRRHAAFNVSAIPSGGVGKGLAERLVVLVKL